MKFKDWSIDTLIEYLVSCKSCGWFDFHKDHVVSGEIHIRNGKKKREMVERNEAGVMKNDNKRIY